MILGHPNSAAQLLAPREGVNDDAVRVVEWLVAEGTPVRAEQNVVVLETTKAVFELPAGAAGYLFPVVAAGSEASVGSPLALVARDSVRPPLPQAAPPSAANGSSPVITAKARLLMDGHGLTAADFPGLEVIRSEDVMALLARRPASQPPPRSFRGELLDPGADWDEILRTSSLVELQELLQALRRRMKARFDRHVPTGSLLHDRWELARDHGFGEGTSVYDECLILGDVTVGKHCWVGPYTVLDGQGGLKIGDYVDIGAGAHLYSHNTIERALTGHQAPLHRQATTIGNCCFIAPHAIIGPGTTLGDHSFVAAGSYVEGVFRSHSYLAGNPARRIGHVELRGSRARVSVDQHGTEDASR